MGQSEQHHSEERLFCVGDIHGCHEKLVKLMQLMPVDPDKDIMVFLGDYINRGPESAKVVDTLLKIQKKFSRVIFLKGNHEQALLEYARSADVALVPSLRQMGIEATLADYHGRIQSLQGLACFPESHRRFFNSLQFAWGWKGYVFTHADITDEVIERCVGTGSSHGQIVEMVEDEGQLLCGRRFWERQPSRDDITVIFGHTPFLTPLVLDRMICIDTGAVYGNYLTGLELPGRQFYHV